MNNTDDFLLHYGVLGMKWGVRKDQKETQKRVKREVLSDRKELSKLNTTRGRKGIMKLRREARDKIQEKINTNPDYAAAVDRLNRNNKRKAVAILAGATAATIITPLILSKATETGINRRAKSRYVREMNRVGSAIGDPFYYGSGGAWSHKTSNLIRKIRQEYATYHNNPTKSEFWNAMTVPGSATAVGTVMDLYRRS